MYEGQLAHITMRVFQGNRAGGLCEQRRIKRMAQGREEAALCRSPPSASETQEL